MTALEETTPQASTSSRQRVLAATVALLDEVGEANLRLSMVANRAGLSTGAIYAAFNSRASLVASANVERLRLWMQAVAQTRPITQPLDLPAPSPDPLLAAALSAALSPEGRSRRLAWADSAATASHDPAMASSLRTTERDFLDSVSAQVKEMQAAHIIRPDLDKRAVATIRMAIAVGVAVTARAYDDDPEFTDRLTHAWSFLAKAFMTDDARGNRL